MRKKNYDLTLLFEGKATHAFATVKNFAIPK
jgi:hypothetical protein